MKNLTKSFTKFLKMTSVQMSAVLCVLSVTVVLLTAAHAKADLGALPVQDGGRIKPYDTLAREALSLVWGKESFKGRPATSVVFSWMLIPETWEKVEFILIRHAGLREAMKLDAERLYYTPEEILRNDRLNLLIQDLRSRREAQEKLDPFFQAVQTLENQVSMFHAMRTGVNFRVLPQAEAGATWKSIAELEGADKDSFQKITETFIKVTAAEARGEKPPRAELDQAVGQFVSQIEARFGDYSHAGKITAELAYNRYHPFRWAWVSFFLSMLFFSFSYFGQSARWGQVGWGLMAVGVTAQIWGITSRVYILGRPPVSNMFETVVWVALVSLLLSVVFYRMTRAKIIPLAATMVATLSLILCDVSSIVLDDAMTPLEPVLRDNFWLLTHVVIIVSSYAAFFLAFFIGDILLVYFLRDEKRFETQIQQGVQAIYRCIQVGVVLLAAGVILGGVWADYSWGRFWGWDPKETWAFIALLGYLVILHGRLVGWLKNFGMAISAVISFSLVIMAWYGVNFVLGAGLHTYGFGAGGVEYVAGFVAAHLIFATYVATLRQGRLRSSN